MSNLWKDHRDNLDGTMAFAPEDVKEGRMARFIDCLLEMDCAFNVYTDGYCWVVEYLDFTKCKDGIHFYALNPEDYEECAEDYEECEE